MFGTRCIRGANVKSQQTRAATFSACTHLRRDAQFSGSSLLTNHTNNNRFRFLQQPLLLPIGHSIFSADGSRRQQQNISTIRSFCISWSDGSEVEANKKKRKVRKSDFEVSTTREWIDLHVAEVFELRTFASSSSEFRKLFARYLISNPQGVAVFLWERFKDDLARDFLPTKVSSTPQGRKRAHTIAYKYAAYELNSLVDEQAGYTLRRLGLKVRMQKEPDDVKSRQDRLELVKRTKEMVANLTTEQREIFNKVMAKVRHRHFLKKEQPQNLRWFKDENTFFVSASGGTGKSFLFNAIANTCKVEHYKVSVVASSAIAALLLEGGKTVHTEFRVPIRAKFTKKLGKLSNARTINIPLQKHTRKKFEQYDLILWDEVSMSSRFLLEAVDRAMRRVFENFDAPFGGVPMIAAGDWRQNLPVVRNAGKDAIIEHSIIHSNLWSEFQFMSLTKNLRVKKGQAEFAKWLLDVGTSPEHRPSLDIPPNLLAPTNNLDEWIESFFPDGKYSNKNVAILSPYLREVNMINQTLLKKFAESTGNDQQREYKAENRCLSDPSAKLDFGSLFPKGGLANTVVLRPGVPVMLQTNIDISSGLVNGTRLIVKKLNKHSIVCEGCLEPIKGKQIIVHPVSQQEIVEENGVAHLIERRQYPLSISYCITILKAQGQTLEKCGIYLNRPVFSHGQLYVALSRCTTAEQISVFFGDNATKTKNIVYNEVVDMLETLSTGKSTYKPPEKIAKADEPQTTIKFRPQPQTIQQQSNGGKKETKVKRKPRGKYAIKNARRSGGSRVVSLGMGGLTPSQSPTQINNSSKSTKAGSMREQVHQSLQTGTKAGSNTQVIQASVGSARDLAGARDEQVVEVSRKRKPRKKRDRRPASGSSGRSFLASSSSDESEAHVEAIEVEASLGLEEEPIDPIGIDGVGEEVF